MSVAQEIAGSALPNPYADIDALPDYKKWELGYISVHDLLPEGLYDYRQEQLSAIGNTGLRLVEVIV